MQTVWAQDPVKDSSSMDLPQPSNVGSSETEKMSFVISFTIWEGGKGKYY